MPSNLSKPFKDASYWFRNIYLIKYLTPELEKKRLEVYYDLRMNFPISDGEANQIIDDFYNMDLIEKEGSILRGTKLAKSSLVGLENA